MRKRTFKDSCEVMVFSADDNLVDEDDAEPDPAPPVRQAGGLVHKTAAARQQNVAAANAPAPKAAAQAGGHGLEQVAAAFGLPVALLKSPTAVGAIGSCDVLQAEIEQLLPQVRM